MASQMIGWFGDGNGYVGDIDLKPEVAHTVSATADWHGNRGDQEV
jgi:iron complex outermembrane receptor protein